MRVPSGVNPTLSALSCLLLSVAVASCSASGNDDSPIRPPSDGAADGEGNGGRGSGGVNGGEADPNILFPNEGNSGERGPNPTQRIAPCVAAGCGAGQRCEETEGTARCVDRTCEELACSNMEQCQADARGGNVCVNLFCSVDVDCSPSDFCNTDSGLCIPDVCDAGTSSCDGQALRVCASNGGVEEVPYSCGSSSYFGSACTASSAGSASCSCEGDWDCPAFTACEVSRCVGTGFEPSCTLPPSSFSQTQPAVEMHWGGDAFNDDAAHDGTSALSPSPWAASSHVQATPIVANLDDDNGDGLVNELDFPEIIFVSYTAAQVDNSGIVRAVHGGGPNRGRDYFAVCGGNVWQEGDPLPATNCSGDGRSRSPVAVGDLNDDSLPEIVQVTGNNGFRVLDSTGQILINRPNDSSASDNGISLSPSIANLDFEGLPELVLGTTVHRFGLDANGELILTHTFEAPAGGTLGANGQGGNRGGPMSCVADMRPEPGAEILAGPSLYRLPTNIPACATPPCAGTLELLWAGATVNAGANALLANEGLCAIADVWGTNSNVAPGPDNPPDGQPEAILIADGNLIILDGASGELIFQQNLEGGIRGGAPNVDDFDGDGFLEIASALSDFYTVVDLQQSTGEGGNCPAWPALLPRDFLPNQADNENPARTPGGAAPATLPSGAVITCSEDADCNPGAVCNTQAGACVCLHNGWQRESDDNSSQLTSSSVFDFNGDGAAEVLYNDECDFRVFDGVSGAVLFSAVSRGRTWTENPVVADVDNDGNAEVVTVMNTEPNLGRCNDDNQNAPAGPNGIRVWGDPQDTWVAARRIWNQQSYHITNVTEGGRIPLRAPESWEQFNGRAFNTYRSQPRSFGVAPDLSVRAIGVFSPDAQCGTLSNQLSITFEIQNLGDLRVGAGVEVSLFGSWGGAEEPLSDAGGEPLTVVLDGGIDPGRSIIAVAEFDVANHAGQTTLPDSVRVQVDTGGAGDFGLERECDETNNSLSREVVSEQLADLTLAAGQATANCAVDSATLEVLVQNNGVAAARGVVVQVFAGNPAQGGELLAEQVVGVPIEPMSSVQVPVNVLGFPRGRRITLWAAVDPGNTIEECNEGDNVDEGDNSILCQDLR